MMNLQYFFVLMLIGSVFSGCGGTKPAPLSYEPKPLPSWYLNPPGNSAAYLYGIGEGANLEEAKKNALDNMVSQLGISISSNYASKMSSHKSYREYVTKDTSFEVKSEVSKIRISNYEVIQREQYKYNRFMLLVRSNKEQLTQSLVKELKAKTKRLETQRRTLASSNPLSRYQFYDRSQKEIKEMFSTVLVLDTLDTSFSDEIYASTVETINAEFQALKRDMTFSLSYDSNSKGFKEEIQVALTNEDKRVVEKQRNNKNHISIVLRTTAEYAKSNGFNIARAVLQIDVKDNNGKVVGGNRINLIGHATQGNAIALNNAVKKLHDLIQKDGIETILGIL